MPVKNILLFVFTILFLILGSWWYLQSSCHECNTKIIAEAAKPLPLSGDGMSIADSSLWSVSSTDHIRFKKSEDNPMIPETTELFFDSVTNYFSRQNNQKMLTVQGHFGSQEINNTGFKNLGIARAESVKSYLITRGMDRNNIFTESKMDDSWASRFPDSVWGGVNFKISTIGQNMPLSEEVLLQSRIVYFESGKNSLLITPELSNYFTQAQAYLAGNKDKSLNITGHTDNIGDSAKNLHLSNGRAEFVGKELQKQNISKAQIITSGFGDQKPITTNDTPEGRAQNRRVEIIIQ